jgi:mono/diheme cytochrome c family protein
MRQGGAGSGRSAVLAWTLAAVFAAAAGVACGGGGEEPAPPEEGSMQEQPAPEAREPEAPAADGGEAAMAEARKIFSQRCATCHGPEGQGDGPASAGLSPKPRNFHEPEWQASVTDDHIHKIILYGGAAVGKSAAMPGNPDLTGKPEVVDALVEHIRSLGDQ